jgi:predicted patatin/cPLA2 family phospholipase
MVSYIQGSISNTNPVDVAYEHEYTHLFLSFCSYVCVIKNKKLNLPNIFLFLLKEPPLREIFKMLCDVETDYDVLKCFLDYDPTLHRSKYIRNYLQQNPKLNVK